MRAACVLVAAVVAAAMSSTWARPRMASSLNTINYYEHVHFSEQEIANKHERHRRSSGEDPMQLKFRAFNKKFHLKFEHDHSFFSPGFRVISHRPEGPVEIPIDISRFYTVYHKGGRRIPAGSAHVGEDGSVQVSFAYKGERYVLEPAHRVLENPTHSNIIYRFQDVQNVTSSNFEGESGFRDMLNQQEWEMKQQKTFERFRVDSGMEEVHSRRRRATESCQEGGISNTCGIALWADHFFIADQGSESAAGLEMISHLRAADVMYQTQTFFGVSGAVSIRLAVASVNLEPNSSAPDYPFSSSGAATANQFLDLFSAIDHSGSCLGHGFTHTDFANNVLGLAWVGVKNAAGICYTGGPPHFNAGISTTLNNGNNLARVVSEITLAHEIGHNFGANHDEDGELFGSLQCAPGGTFGNYIMYRSATDGSKTNNDNFSPCSLDEIGFLASTAGTCFSESFESVCGNGIVELAEECDCGVTGTGPAAIAACQSGTQFGVDPCCLPNCTIDTSQGFECSPTRGECCNSTCHFIGYDSFVGGPIPLPASPANGGDLLENGGLRCGNQQKSGCIQEQYCVANSVFKGACPPANWIYDPNQPDSNQTLNEFADNSVPSCADFANVTTSGQRCHWFHKAQTEVCNGNRLCTPQGCTGDVCTLYTRTNESGVVYNDTAFLANFASQEAERCLVVDGVNGNTECDISCSFVGSGNDTECISTRVYSTTAHGISMGVQAFFREGESCSKGTCSASECTNDKNVQGWIKDNWPVVVGMILGSILLLWLAHVTYRRENIEDLRPKRFSLRRQESVQMTPASSQQARQQPKLASIARPGSQQAGAGAPRGKMRKGDARKRLAKFFPTVEDNTIFDQAMAGAKSEEDAVKRLLRNGHPLAAI